MCYRSFFSHIAGDISHRYGHLFNQGRILRYTYRDSLVRVGTQDHTPEPGQRLEELPAEGSFYVHIWDFNKAIARSERLDNVHTYNSPGRLICRPGRLAQSCFDNDDAGIITNHPYTTAVCPTGFSTRYFDQFFLEQDRLTLIWARPGSVQVKIVSPSPIMPTSQVGLDVGQGRIAHSPEQSQQTK
ncbi:hypothetical protein EDD22DRAFT_348609 [Suillus occidentalis]|nr:hypothetical protein EDD22DRAFT_348609 [Suillus occidentalis]